MATKILLLASATLAAAVLTASAAQANAPEWYFGAEPETISEPTALSLSGELAMVMSSGFRTGPCTVVLEGLAKNVEGMASGTISSAYTVELHCQTAIPKCDATVDLEANTNFPWSITGATVTGAPGIEISQVKLTSHYNSTCQTFGIPSTVTTAGTMTGIVQLSECISFEGHKDDLLIGGVLPVDMNGEICAFPLLLK